MAFKLTTFGEVLLRISSSRFSPFACSEESGFHFGGSELNVSLTASSLGVQSHWVSFLPKSDMGQWILEQLEQTKLETRIYRHGDHMAVYFLERGNGVRSSRVFERILGPLALDDRESISWKEHLQKTSLFHTTGISSNLSEKTLQDVTCALNYCKENGIEVSYDFNFRERLSPLELAKKRQKPLLPMIDYLFGGEKDLSVMLELDVEKSLTDQSDWAKVQEVLFDRYSFKEVILSQRKEEESKEFYRVVSLSKESMELSPWMPVSEVERIGMGDAMTAGYLAALSQNKSQKERTWQACACAVLKSSLPGDFAFIHPSMLERYLKNSNSWR